MEAGGAAGACFEARPAPGFFMVRGVSDMADQEKGLGHGGDVAALRL
jgi:hypothetical protein